MFDIASSELILVALIALLVIGPKDLPRVLRYIGNWLGKARRMAAHFRSGIDEMVRQSELEELEKKWQADNERIMREHPPQHSAAREYDSLPPPDVGPAQVADAEARTTPKPKPRSKTKPKAKTKALP